AGKKDKAAVAFQQALDLDPRSAAAKLGLGRALIAQGKEEDAIVQLQTVVTDKPDDLASVLLLRSIYERRGRPDQATAVLEAATKAAPRQLVFGLALSEVYLRAGRYEEALARASELLTIQRDLPPARLIRGEANLGKGEAEKAREDFQEAVRVDPRS